MLISRIIFMLILQLLMTSVAAETYGPVKSGEMLWVIAGKAYPTTEITRYQSVIALLHANPDAFSTPCNLNSLKIGTTLTIPHPGEFPLLSAAEALREFSRQQTEWKAYRQGQGIRCAPSVTENNAVTTGIVKPFPPVTAQVIPPTEKITPKESHAPSPQNQPAALETAFQFSDLIQWFDYRKWQAQLAQQPLGWILASLILIVLGILGISLFGWLLRRAMASPPESSRSLMTVSEHFFTDSHSPLVAATNAAMEERLSAIRLCLAQSELQKVEHLLQEVEQKGTAIQQFEARQLAAIYKTMANLQEEFQKTQKLLLVQQTPAPAAPTTIPDAATTPDSSQGEYLPQRYLPENKEKVFELVDTVILVLDHELQAQGQLLEAYQQRHPQPILEVDDYQVVNKAESSDALAAKSAPNPPHPKSTRYL
jgi:FimV-like protein